MKPKDAKQELTTRIKNAGLKLAALSPRDGFNLMLDFYNEVRADKCDLKNDGDMLLYQWGVYENLDDSESFHLDLTRQFIVSDGDDDAMSQLSLTFFYKPPEKYKKIEGSNEWCSTPKQLKTFGTFIAKSPAYQAVEGVKADDVKLQYSRI